MIIRRYLLREIFQTFSAVILVTMLIGVSNKVVRLVGKAASGDIAPNILMQVIAFQIPELLAFLMPIALFLAILLCYSRFFTDNEIPVMFACGISWQRLLGVSIALSLAVMLFVGGLTCYWGPKIAQHRERLLSSEGPMFLVQTISPGRFHSIQKDKLVFYVAQLSGDRSELKRIFIADQPKGSMSEQEDGNLLTAQAGSIITDPQTGATYLKLDKGRRYHGTPGEKNYSILEFDEYKRLLEGTRAPEGLFFHRTMPTLMLWKFSTPGNLAELQWRLSIPLSAPLLALIAVPLSRVSPRKGRFGRLFIAVVICIVYYNLLTISKRWIATGTISPDIGVWWVHLLLFAGGLVFLAKTSGRYRQWIQVLKQKICKRDE